MSTEKDPEFGRSKSFEGTSGAAPIPAALLPPGLADHPDYTIKRSWAGARWAWSTWPRIDSWGGTRCSR